MFHNTGIFKALPCPCATRARVRAPRRLSRMWRVPGPTRGAVHRGCRVFCVQHPRSMRFFARRLDRLRGGFGIFCCLRGDRVGSRQPTRQIHIGTARRTKGAIGGDGLSRTDRTRHARGSVWAAGQLDSFSMGRIRSDRNHGGMALAELDHPPLPASGNIHGSV